MSKPPFLARISPRNLVGGLITFAIAAAFFFVAGSYPADSARFPQLIAGVMMIASVLVALSPHSDNTDDTHMDASVLDPRVLLIVAVTFAYICVVPIAGFMLSSFVFIFTSAFLLGFRRYVWLVGTAVVFIAIVKYVFGAVFNVQLPNDVVLAALLGMERL